MRPRHILIINQHGENRGDEAAQRGMLQGICDEIGDTRFTMICQYRDRNLTVDFNHEVSTLPMLIPLPEFIRGILYLGLRFLKIRMTPLLGPHTRKIVKAYETADLIVSAPGGPYLGDMYSGFLSTHELAHWFMIYLGVFFKKPLFLYAPSAGPFNKKWLNPLRRFLYGKFSCLTTREDISKRYLQALLPGSKIILTADAAIQRAIPPMDRHRFFKLYPDCPKDAFIVSVSLNDYSYPLSSTPGRCKKRYEAVITQVLSHIVRTKKDAFFLFFPQLYGSVHSDVKFLEKMGARLPRQTQWALVDPAYTSDQQQALFGVSDFCIASRYHPQIFAACQRVPLIAICYEHKQFGFMDALGMQAFAFDIYHLNAQKMVDSLTKAFARHQELSHMLGKNIQPLIQSSKRTSVLVGETISEKGWESK